MVGSRKTLLLTAVPEPSNPNRIRQSSIMGPTTVRFASFPEVAQKIDLWDTGARYAVVVWDISSAGWVV
jgi:hypothetical protein